MRPAWHTNALSAKLNVSSSRLLEVLPAVAYRMMNGPWGKLWIRYGVDPRTDPFYRVYQSIDFRHNYNHKVS